MVKENPYRLAQDIRGIGFKTVDRIALDIGIDPHSPLPRPGGPGALVDGDGRRRARLCALGELLAACMENVEIREALLTDALTALQESRRVVREDEAVYLRGLHQAERGVADTLRALMSAPRQRHLYTA